MRKSSKSGRIQVGDGPIPIPMFPAESSWTLPRDLPNLASASRIGLDTEGRDPQLKRKGPGVRRDGYTCGISVAVPEGQSWYLPFDHATGDQLDRAKVIQWAKDNLCRPNQPKVGANLLYDLDYLAQIGVDVKGPFYDVQVAEPLIDENKLVYSLDSLALQYLGEHKDEVLLRQACRDRGLKGKPQEHLWRLDPKYVGPYAEVDALHPLRIFEKQEKILREQKLETVFDIETRLIPMLLHMRRGGVKIDLGKVTHLHDQVSRDLNNAKNRLKALAGKDVDFWAADSIASVFNKMGMSYPTTAKQGKPSFQKGWLEGHHSEVAKWIVKCREYDKLIGTFIEGSLIDMMVGDRIHCQFNQLKSDDSGTVTGRFSSSNPNLQFIPTRTELGKMIRKCFIPDDGHWWIKQDYSQIEIRVLIHYAMGEGSDAVVKAFCENPFTDYHQWCADVAGISRREAKTINFGLIYGMGADKLSNSLGISLEEARRFIEMYYSKLPFLRETVETATRVTDRRGYIKTMLGRRRRFPVFEARDNRIPIMPSRDVEKLRKEVDKYVKNHPELRLRNGISRYKCYKAFNAADQGSSADIMKKAMVEVWESGVCDVVKMYLTVHDELDYGMPMTHQGFEAVNHIKEIMENTMPLRIPVIADTEIGSNWGEVSNWDNEIIKMCLTA